MIRKLLFLTALPLLLATGCKPPEEPLRYNIAALRSPVIFSGDSLTAYRDPAVLFHENRFYLFFTKTDIIGDSIYTYTAQSESDDLLNWTVPKRITPNRQDRGFSSPGNVIRFRDEWILCLRSYPRPDYTVDQMTRYAGQDARIYLMRSPDLRQWSLPELMRVKGNIPLADMRRITDPFLLEDKDEKGKWWCFYKQDGMSMSYSYDLRNWTPSGSIIAGENVSALVENNEYILIHSPRNGMAIKKSRDLKNWADWGPVITLGQDEWEWARGRVTGGTVINLSRVRGINAYVMFFSGSGPGLERDISFDSYSSIGIAWSKDLINWSWPGQSAAR